MLSSSKILKQVKAAHPELFKEFTKPKVKEIEKVILYAMEMIHPGESTEAAPKKAVKGDSKIGEILKNARIEADLSQVELAKRCKISQANISTMENGKRPITLSTAKKLGKVLKCNFETFL